MFNVVYIPNSVYRELMESSTYLEEVQMIRECSFLFEEKVENEKAVFILRKLTGFDTGESEAIVLADEKQSDVLLMDEYKRRQAAKTLGIAITGTIGILAHAFDEGLLSQRDIEVCIEKFKENNIRISEKLYQILREHMDKSRK